MILIFNTSNIFNIKPVIRFFLITGLFFYSIFSSGQDTIGKIYLDSASLLLKSNELEDAGHYYVKAKENFEKIGDWNSWYSAYNGLRKIAQRTANRSFTVDSMKHYYAVLPDSAHNIIMKSYEGRAYNLGKLGLQLQSLKEYQNALMVLRKNNPSNTKKELRYIRSISNCYSRLGDQISSLKYANEGIQIATEKNDIKQLCFLLLGKGNSHTHNGDSKEAINTLKSSIEVCGESISSNCAIAEAYMFLNETTSANKYLNKADSLTQAGYGKDWEKGINKYYWSEYFVKVKDYENSIKLKKEIIDEHKGNLGIRDFTKALVRLAQIEELDGKYEDMVQNVHFALSLHYEKLDSTNIYDRPIKDKILPDIWVIEALYLKAKYFKSKFETDPTDVKSNEESAYYHKLLFEYFDLLKSTYDANSSKYRIGQHTRKYYQEVVDFSYDKYKTTSAQEEFTKCFEFSQSANAYVLKNAISERQALDIIGLSQDSIDLYTKLQQQANNGDDTENITKLEDLKKALGENFSYFANDVEDGKIGLNDVKKSLKEGQLLLKYFYLRNDLLVFRITNKTSSIQKITLPNSLDSLIDIHQDLISQSSKWNEKVYKDVSYHLYQLILEESLGELKDEEINHLIIIPDGPLKKLSFSSMVQNRVEDFINSEDYLINDYEISYLYYAAQLKQNKIRSKSKNKDGFISFGIEYEDDFLKEILQNFQTETLVNDSSRTISLSSLNFADDEAIAIAEIFDGDYMTNNQVTKSEVQQQMKNYGLLHFSAHAFVDEENYLNSFLMLNKDESDSYKLTYKDILNMGLSADFVVLSACQTANGKDFSGESLMSLSRAFVQGGCSSTMSSYWNASDNSTMELMKLFYAGLSEGESKSSALRRAQLEYLTNDDISLPSTRSPYYWSSWAIYGDNAKVDKNRFWEKMNASSLFALVGLLIIALVYGGYKMRATNNH